MKPKKLMRLHDRRHVTEVTTPSMSLTFAGVDGHNLVGVGVRH